MSYCPNELASEAAQPVKLTLHEVGDFIENALEKFHN